MDATIYVFVAERVPERVPVAERVRVLGGYLRLCVAHAAVYDCAYMYMFNATCGIAFDTLYTFLLCLDILSLRSSEVLFIVYGR